MAIRSALACRFAGLSILLALAGTTSADADCGLPNVESAVCASIVDLGASSEVHGLSADGRVVVGGVNGAPVRWVDGVAQPLGPLPANSNGYGKAVNADGSVVLGRLRIQNQPAAFRWTAAAGLELLPGLGNAFPNDVSDDESVIVGARAGCGTGIGSGCASRWVDGVLEDLSGPAMGTGMQVLSVSPDGSRAVGFGYFDLLVEGTQAFLWDDFGATNLMQSWRDVGDVRSEGIAYSITPDGNVAVGWAGPPIPAPGPWPDQRTALPVRWDLEGGVEVTFLDVGGLPGGAALDVSADGARIVGSVSTSEFDGSAVLWDDGGSFELVADRLAALGADVEDWSLYTADHASDDGRTVTGAGMYASGFRYYVATLTPTVGLDIRPGSPANVIPLEAHGRVMVALYGSSSLDVAALDTGVLAFGPGAAPVVAAFPLEDLNGDGFADRRVLFQIPAIGLASGDTSACLEAPGVDGFRVCSHVAVVPGSCGDGFALALVVPPVLLAARRRR